jgi:hypothetical protein
MHVQMCRHLPCGPNKERVEWLLTISERDAGAE